MLARFVRVPLFAAATGYTPKAVERKIEAGVWRQGHEYRIARPLLELASNERNRRAAARMLAEIEDKIRHGVFDLGAYFPDAVPNEEPATAGTFGHYAKLWLLAKAQKAPSTRHDYGKILDRVWLAELKTTPVAGIRYSDLMAIIATLSIGGKTLNNNLIPLRGVLEFAKRDRAITENPAASIENAPVQKRPPDPFSLDEVDAILADMADREPDQVANYFAAAFFGGFRPSEQIALAWPDLDFLREEVRVQRAIVRGVAKPTTKTYLVRDVELNERAWVAFEAQSRHTQLAGGAIFANPVTGKAWPDEKRQHQFWGRSLRRLGLRYREPYQTAHIRHARADGRRESFVGRAADGPRQPADALQGLREVDRRRG